MKKIMVTTILLVVILVGSAYSLSTINTVENIKTAGEITDKDSTMSIKPLSKNTMTSINDVEIIVTTNKKVYWIGEPVVITLKLINPGDEDITLTMGSQPYDYRVINKRGRKIYQWSDDKAFILILRKITIPAGKTISWKTIWFQKRYLLPKGPFILPLPCFQVRPGDYTIIGMIPTIDKCYEDTVRIRISHLYHILAR